MIGLGSVACPFCGDGIRAAFQSRPDRLAIVLDKSDLAVRHSPCISSAPGGTKAVA